MGSMNPGNRIGLFKAVCFMQFMETASMPVSIGRLVPNPTGAVCLSLAVLGDERFSKP